MEETNRKDYVIVTDSTADLSPELIQQLEIKVIPLQFVIWKGNE